MIARWHMAVFAVLMMGVLGAGAENPPVPPPVPMQTTLQKSPVELFRELLAMNADEREKKLASRPAGNRTAILAKLREYEAMEQGEREIRLQVTQLRWDLLRMVNLSAEERSNLMLQLPDREREPLKARLAEWDTLPVAVQSEVLDYEKNLEKSRAAKFVPATNSVADTGAPPMPPVIPNGTAQVFEHFRKLPMAERQQVAVSCRHFFELTEEEKQKTLGLIPAQSRVEASKALKNLSNLRPDQREKYFEAFQKFSEMSDGERREFVNNFVRWKNLTEEERRAWRNVVRKLEPLPPMPPGIRGPLLPPPMPPMSFQASR